MTELSLSNVVNISVSQQNAGINAFNTSNLALFTYDTPGESFGTDGYKVYVGPEDVATDFGSTSLTYKCALNVFGQQPNILMGGGQLIVVDMSEHASLQAAITTMAMVVQFFGIIVTSTVNTWVTDAYVAKFSLSDVATTVQAMNKLAFIVDMNVAQLEAAGGFDTVRSSSQTHTRCLFYGDGSQTTYDVEAPVLFAAAYASRCLSVNFEGSNTTTTMHLKSLANVTADPTLDQTNLTKAAAVGADVYGSFQGVSKTFTSGANMFVDRIYNQLWFVNALTVASFNALAQADTKIPQTESGMDSFKGYLRNVCEQALVNGYAAPGTWNSPTLFGNPGDLISIVAQRGYYMYSAPVAKQSQADREARKAPLVQIALKEAGALHSATVVVNVNQ